MILQISPKINLKSKHLTIYHPTLYHLIAPENRLNLDSDESFAGTQWHQTCGVLPNEPTNSAVASRPRPPYLTLKSHRIFPTTSQIGPVPMTSLTNRRPPTSSCCPSDWSGHTPIRRQPRLHAANERRCPSNSSRHTATACAGCNCVGCISPCCTRQEKRFQAASPDPITPPCTPHVALKAPPGLKMTRSVQALFSTIMALCSNWSTSHHSPRRERKLPQCQQMMLPKAGV